MFRPSLLLPSDDYRSSSMRRVVCVCSGIVIESGIFLLMALLSWLLSVLHAPNHWWATLLSPLLVFDCVVGLLGLRQLHLSRCWLLQSERRRRRLLLFSICMRALSTVALSLVLLDWLPLHALPLFPFLSYVGGLCLNRQADDRYSWVRLHAWDLPLLLTAINFCCSARATAAASAADPLQHRRQQPQLFPADGVALAAAAAATRLQRSADAAGHALPSAAATADTVSPHSLAHAVQVVALPAVAHAVAAAEKAGAWSGAALLWPEFLLCLVMLAICALLWHLLNADASLRQDSLLRLSLSFLLHLSASFFLAVVFLAQYIDQRFLREAAAAAAAAEPDLPLLLAPVVVTANSKTAAAAASESRGGATSSETRSSTTAAGDVKGSEVEKRAAAGAADVTIDSVLPGYVVAAEAISLIPPSYWAVPLVFALLLVQLLTAALMVYCVAKHTQLDSPPFSPRAAEAAALLPAGSLAALEEGYGVSANSSSCWPPAGTLQQQQRPPLVRDMTVSLERVGHHFYRLLLNPPEGGEDDKFEKKEVDRRAADAAAEATGTDTCQATGEDLENDSVQSQQLRQEQHRQQQQPQQQLQQHQQQRGVEEPQRGQDLQQQEESQQSVGKQEQQRQHRCVAALGLQAGLVPRQQQEEEHQEKLRQEELLQDELRQQLLADGDGHEDNVEGSLQQRRWRWGEAQLFSQQQTRGRRALAVGDSQHGEGAAATRRHFGGRGAEVHVSIDVPVDSPGTRNESSVAEEAAAAPAAVAVQAVRMPTAALGLPSAEAPAGAAAQDLLWCTSDADEEHSGGEAAIAAEERQQKQELRSTIPAAAHRENSRRSRRQSRRQHSGSRSPRRSPRRESKAEKQTAASRSRLRRRRLQSRSGAVDSRKGEGEEEMEEEEEARETEDDEFDAEEGGRGGKEDKRRKEKLKEREGQQRQQSTKETHAKKEAEVEEEGITKIRRSTGEIGRRGNFSSTTETQSVPSASSVPSAAIAAGGPSWWRPWRYFMPQRAAAATGEEEEARAAEVEGEAAGQEGAAATQEQAIAAGDEERVDSSDGGEEQEKWLVTAQRRSRRLPAATPPEVLAQEAKPKEITEKAELATSTEKASTSAGQGGGDTQGLVWTATAAEAEGEKAEDCRQDAPEEGRFDEGSWNRRRLVSHTHISSSSARAADADIDESDRHVRASEQQIKERGGRRHEMSRPVEGETREVTVTVSEEGNRWRELQSEERQVLGAGFSLPEAGADEEAGEAARAAALVGVAGERPPSGRDSVPQMAEETDTSGAAQSGAAPSTTTTRTAGPAGMRVGVAAAVAAASTRPRATAANGTAGTEAELTAATTTPETSAACTTEAAATEAGGERDAVSRRAPSLSRAAAATEGGQTTGMESVTSSRQVAFAATQRGEAHRAPTPEEPDLCIICYQRVRVHPPCCCPSVV